MSDISKALASLEDDFTSADNLVNDIYDRYFSTYFKRESEMYLKFQDSDVPITDGELEWIITVLPLELKSVAGALAQFRQHNEIVKLKIKQRKNAKKDPEDIDDEYKLMTIIYSAVISRVESEMTFSKELIMGAKKVWDARRNSESAPIKEINTDNDELMDYPNNPNLDF